jgi:hypothetical protein
MLSARVPEMLIDVAFLASGLLAVVCMIASPIFYQHIFLCVIYFYGYNYAKLKNNFRNLQSEKTIGSAQLPERIKKQR